MKAIWKDEVIAEASVKDLLRIEGNWYFPPKTLNWQYFEESDHHTTCPWKGEASYYDVIVDGSRNMFGAWYYPEPKEGSVERVKHDFELRRFLERHRSSRIERMLTYYTDGSCSPNPGPGGFSVIKNMQPAFAGHELDSTNIRMEGRALIAALKDAAGEECQIYTDSEFWINVITKWAPGWAAKDWKKKGGDIKNLELVKEAYELYGKSDAILTWVRGHEGDPGNEMADEWANYARTKRLDGPIDADAV